MEVLFLQRIAAAQIITYEQIAGTAIQLCQSHNLQYADTVGTKKWVSSFLNRHPFLFVAMNPSLNPWLRNKKCKGTDEPHHSATKLIKLNESNMLPSNAIQNPTSSAVPQTPIIEPDEIWDISSDKSHLLIRKKTELDVNTFQYFAFFFHNSMGYASGIGVGLTELEPVKALEGILANCMKVITKQEGRSCSYVRELTTGNYMYPHQAFSLTATANLETAEAMKWLLRYRLEARYNLCPIAKKISDLDSLKLSETVLQAVSRTPPPFNNSNTTSVTLIQHVPVISSLFAPSPNSVFELNQLYEVYKTNFPPANFRLVDINHFVRTVRMTFPQVIADRKFFSQKQQKVVVGIKPLNIDLQPPRYIQINNAFEEWLSSNYNVVTSSTERTLFSVMQTSFSEHCTAKQLQPTTRRHLATLICSIPGIVQKSFRISGKSRRGYIHLEAKSALTAPVLPEEAQQTYSALTLLPGATK